MPITTENYEEIQETLETLADEDVGAVKPTAQHVLDQKGGEEFSEAEGTRGSNSSKTSAWTTPSAERR
jgi:hypothetical protein